jgi:hypothetical protein
LIIHEKRSILNHESSILLDTLALFLLSSAERPKRWSRYWTLMDKDQNDALRTLAKLRQGALLLSMANKYFCDPPLLEKIGLEMNRAILVLPDQIKSLKSRFPGKLEEELKTGPLVSDLLQRVKQLRNPEPETRIKCGKGELGRELEINIGNLTAAVYSIAGRVEGRTVVHASRKASSMVMYRITNLISTLLHKIIPGLVLLAVIAALVFGYLFWSMDREEPVLNRIAVLEVQVHSSQKILGEIDREKKRISQRIEELKRNEMARNQKIEFMELGQELHKVGERQLKVEIDIDRVEKEMKELSAKLKEIKNKSLIARLFRF